MTDIPISEMTVEELLAYEACSYGKVTRVCQQDAAVNELARRATAGEAAAKELDDLRGADAAGWRDRCLKAEQRMGEAQLNAAEMMRQRDRFAKVAGNAEQGDCLRGEMGTIECPPEKPCGVCKLTRERDAVLARVAAFEAQRDRRWQSVKGYLTKATDGMDWAQMIRHFAEAEKAALGKLAETEKQRDAALERERRLREALHRISLGSQNSMTSTVALGAEARFALQQTQPAPARPMPVETFTEKASPLGSFVCPECGQRTLGLHFCEGNEPEAPKPPPADDSFHSRAEDCRRAQAPADTAASALADVQAIREQARSLESRSYGANERIDRLERSIRDAYESYGLLRDRVAALEGKS